MEFDAQSQCSDEGIELPTSEYGYPFPSDSLLECMPRDFLEARTLYLLLPKNVLISRAARLQWLLNRLNTTILVSSTKLLESSLDIEVIAAIPREQNINLVCSKFLITYRTEVKFISHSYRIVYCLDMSPSHANTGGKEMGFDKILDSFKTSIEGLSKQFTVPGNSLVFQPTIHLTIMANTPFFITPAQQVILKGIQMTPKNVNEIIKCVETHFYMIENKIAEACMQAIEKIEVYRSSHNTPPSGRFEVCDIGRLAKTPMVTPDANFVNMLRYSMLAIHLLPEPALSHILVITDGIVSMPDSSVMETMLHQLHYDAISVSFLKVGAAFHPPCGAGLVPYIDLLYFFAHSTLGTCMESFPKVVHDPVMLFNCYQEKVLVWSFHNPNCRLSSDKLCDNVSSWTQINDRFHCQRLPNLLSKRQTEDSTNTSVLILLARRMREGFTIDNIFFMNGNLEVRLIHQWKSSIFIQYKVIAQWPIVQNLTHFEVHVHAPYEFLHDMTCLIKKETKSAIRLTIIQRFWSRLSQISTGDLTLASLLSNFSINKDWYSLPDSVKSGLPVFTSEIPPNSDTNKTVLIARDNSCVRFINIWQGICQLETNHWRKWFHTHKISLILSHDTPLPSTLYTANSSQRYPVVQCRQAVVALYGMLSKWSSFVLIDNDTYLKLIFEEGENQIPLGFCIVRVSTKFPSAVLNLGFSTETPGQVRYENCDILKAHLASLSYLPKAKEPSCCVLLHKPLEKILIRYERVPNTYSTVVFPDGTQPLDGSSYYSTPSVSFSLFTTLSRYLFHKRWIWNTKHIANPRLPDSSVSRILNTLTRMRLKEGYHFAYSSSGIATMVLELWLDSNASCVVQYVLFPPYYDLGEDFTSDSDEEAQPPSELDAELEMITEVWVEPQYGKVVPNESRTSYFNNKTYHQIAEAIYENDLECINVLLTMEHLSLMCQNKALASGVSYARSNSSKRTSLKSSKSDHYQYVPEDGSPWNPIITPRIEHVPFTFDPIKLLHLTQQTELLFSLFNELPPQSYMRTAKSDAANKLLLNNIFDHFALLHDREVKLSEEECQTLTIEVLRRHSNNPLHYCPILEGQIDRKYRWKCYVKGISVTHVILTFVPASVEDLKALIGWGDEEIIEDEAGDRTSSRGSNVSDVPINSSKALCLPVYVYDCPLKLLVNAYIEKENGLSCAPDDAFLDHRFKYTHHLTKEVKERLKGSDSESCSDETDTPSTKNIREHCNALEMTIIKCYVLSLFVALHLEIYLYNSDVQNAMDLCDDDLIEIDITEFISKTCSHAPQEKTSRETLTCSELRNLHTLTKKKFLTMVCGAFSQISTNVEYYYFRHPCGQNDVKPNSDDEAKEKHELKLRPNPIDGTNVSEVSPLFLHFVCTLKWDGRDHTNKSVKVLPTCLKEVLGDLEDFEEYKPQVTLDILCLTLPARVQNILAEYTQQGLRTTSFCSEGGFQRTISTTSDASVNSDIPQPLKNLTVLQKHSIDRLCEEINWLLEDEICTSLLDTYPVTDDTLSFVTNHIISGHSIRSSCKMDKLTLNFVYGSEHSHQKFLDEFNKMKLPSGYTLCKKEYCYYVAKDAVSNKSQVCVQSPASIDFTAEARQSFDGYSNVESSCKDDTVSQQSEISSGSVTGTDAGYDEDISEDDDEECDWLVNINNKRTHLPNFWLILRIEQDVVYVYFHCRFLELETAYVEEYLDTHRAVCDSISDLCKRVNQLLLLQSLYKSRTCESLLEPDDSPSIDLGASGSMYGKPKGYDPSDTSDDSEKPPSRSLSEASLHLKPGYFSCPVVWEKLFFVHPRLKTGSGNKSGASRGIMALKNILEKFAVTNRSNMFIYRDEDGNVFYLRLYESSNIANTRGSFRLTEDGGPFSRSPSIASLPIGHNKPILTSSDQSIASIVSADHLRPRVRSFGEKESRIYDTKDSREKLNEDNLILRVHGITEVGNDIECGFVKVLQNKLDDAVLDFLSGTLARNAMCPLTPEDVRFIQKPQPPDSFIRCTVQEFALQLKNTYTFIHYLRQNLLQFLNVPKYTDSRPECQFKDYSVGKKSKTLPLDNIFVYNQSQSLTSGSRGIACIVVGIIPKSDEGTLTTTDSESFFKNVFLTQEYQNCVNSCVIPEGEESPEPYLEFRLWKQGRINMDNLTKKLTAAVQQATWDIVSEYYLLKKPFCIEDFQENVTTIPRRKTEISENFNMEQDIDYNCDLNLNFDRNIKRTVKDTLPKKVDAQLFPTRKYSKRIPVQQICGKTIRSLNYDMEKDTDPEPLTNDSGVLSIVYSKYLPSWMEFGDTIKAPAVRKHVCKLTNLHLPNLIVKELITMLPDHPKAFRSISNHSLKSSSEDVFVPFISSEVIQRYVIISRSFLKWQNIDEDCSELPAALNPQNLKHTRKFLPAVLNNVMIPRQKLFWISIESENIIVYTYNWAKENMDKLIANCMNLAQWLALRSCFLNSAISQKLGVFNNQPLTRKCFTLSTNNYYSLIGSLEGMSKFPREPLPKKSPSFNLPMMLEIFRDTFCNTKYTSSDAVAIFTIEMREMKSMEKKNRDEMKKLHNMYQSRSGNASVSQLNLLMFNCRILHFVHTPLQFLPRWRLKCAFSSDPVLQSNPAAQLMAKLQDKEKESWHTDLCYSYFHEYRSYLQNLGFSPLQIEDSQTENTGLFMRDKSSYNSVYYIQRTILGGILIFTISFEEPFFVCRLYGVECGRLQIVTSRASVNGFTLSFLDESDKAKVLMHLHSFTYDYHLRSIYNYLTDKTFLIPKKYNVHCFLDEFVKYYAKAPYYARNLAHAGTLTIANLITEGKQLFDYLRANASQYGFSVLEIDNDGPDFILIQVSTVQHDSYKDSQDRMNSEDFNMTLVVYNLCAPYKPTDKILHLKFYLMLTSKGDQAFPKLEDEPMLGKFRMVPSGDRSILGDVSFILPKSEPSNEADDNDDNKTVILPRVEIPRSKMLGNIIIRQEKVKYLGYYSPHEQSMLQLLLEKAKIIQTKIRDIVSKGMVHCRTNLLWNRLIAPHESTPLNFKEFIELKRLAKLTPLSQLNPSIGPLLNQPLTWYQNLSKLLLQKYQDNHRIFTSPDLSVTYYVILNQRYYGAIMLLSIDTGTSRGELYGVYREPSNDDADPLGLGYEKSLRDGFVKCISYHIWSSMIIG